MTCHVTVPPASIERTTHPGKRGRTESAWRRVSDLRMSRSDIGRSHPSRAWIDRFSVRPRSHARLDRTHANTPAPREGSSRAGGKLTSDLVQLLREISDPLVVVVVEALPALHTEATICDVLLNSS